MDLFVLPTYREGFPTVSLEASSMNLPVIITKATGCTESILENKTGLFITNEPKVIAEKIQYYLINDQIAKQHGIQGRFFVQQNFEQTKIWDLISEKLKL
jgi:glycosyltransferase involved in cell wall biosynthesis